MNGERGRTGRTARSLAGAVGIAILALCAGARAHGQMATEQFIPIGKSPGVSQKVTSIGTIDSVSVRQRTITIAEPNVRRTVVVTGNTRIWLDRSRLRLPNLRGRFEDLQKGRRVEVKYLDPDRRLPADWVKVEMTAP